MGKCGGRGKNQAVTPLSPPDQGSGADAQNRTADLPITNRLLYHLSYVGNERVWMTESSPGAGWQQ
jgi:hypothetical protein